MKIQLDITEHRIADLLCGALEGGSNYWITDTVVVDPAKDGKPWGDDYTPTYISATFSTGGKVMIDPGEGEPVVTLDRAALQRGLEVMAKIDPCAFADFLSERDDAGTADVYLQCCLFGNVQFG